MEEVHRIGLTRLSDPDNTRENQIPFNIIFVHGLRGHPRDTWASDREVSDDGQPNRRNISSMLRLALWALTCSDETEKSSEPPKVQVFWPRDFLAQDLPGARIWTYGYNADVVGGLFQSNNQNSISQHGRDLTNKLERARNLRGPVVFVAHSLGGLLVKYALTRSNTLLFRTRSIIFLGTPHRGTPIAGWGQIATNLASLTLQDSNRNILKSLKVDSEVLDNIHDRFIDLLQNSRIRVHTFQEARGISGIKGLHGKVVDDYSSRLALPSVLETVESIDANHREMARCRQQSDPHYREILSVLSHIISKASSDADVIDEGGQNCIEKEQRQLQEEWCRLEKEQDRIKEEHRNIEAEQRRLEEEQQRMEKKKTYLKKKQHRLDNEQFRIEDEQIRIEGQQCHAERRNNLLQRLYILPYEDRKDRNPRAVCGTCQWFKNHSLFRGWRENRGSALLWVSADPGCGKSVLARHLVDDVLRSSDTNPKILCYFFFKDDFEDQRSPENAMCCILRQIFYQRPGLLSRKILNEFEQKGNKILNSFTSLWEIFLDAINSINAGEIVCIIDALDECEEIGRSRLTAALCHLYGRRISNRPNPIKFLLTSRPYDNIRREFQILKNRLPTIHLSGEDEKEVDKICGEIDMVINAKVDLLSEKLQLCQNERQVLQEELTRMPNRTYLWVYLIFDIIEDSWSTCTSTDELSNSIRKLPTTVEAAYDKILCKSLNQEKAKRLLHIVTAAQKPLTLEEMELALSIRENHQTYSDLGLRGESQFSKTVRELCGLFVTIIGSKIYLLHQTAKEFLVKEQILSENSDHDRNHFRWKSSLEPGESHRILAEICLWHLCFTEFAGKTSLSIDKHIFLRYATSHCFAHLQQARNKDDPPIQNHLLRLFHPKPRQSLLRCMLYSEDRKHFGDTGALTFASYFGFSSVVAKLLGYGALSPETEKAALYWAASRQHEPVVRLLVERGVGIDLKEDFNSKVLFKAIRNKRESIARLLLSHGDIEARNNTGQAPLTRAVTRRDSCSARFLIEAGADIESKDDQGWSPMFHASSTCDVEMAQLLLGKGASTALRNNAGQTLLWGPVVITEKYKVDDNFRNIVDLILKSGVDIDAKDEMGQTVLWVAVQRWIPSMIKELLDRGADINARDKYERTTLSYAYPESGGRLWDFGFDDACQVPKCLYDERVYFLRELGAT